MLEISGLNAWYDESHVLHGLDFEVREGEVVTLLGRNGAGKTTALKSIMGLMGKRTGSVKFRGKELIAARPDVIGRAGIGFCPEERGIFSGLTVEENLMLPPVVAPGGMSIADIHTLFPNLKERSKSPGTKLSGGEQQMLAIARALIANPAIILLDEPMEGLAPLIARNVEDVVRAIRVEGNTILLVEQNAEVAMSLSDRGYVLSNGRVVAEGTIETLRADAEVMQRYLAV
jgi:branched-chain amino acid transport system ATP-binding protein